MKEALALMLVMMGAFALNFSYDGEIFVEPGVEKTVHIYIQSINESGNYFVGCSSNLSMSCPNYVTVLAGKEIMVPLVLQAKRGFYPVNVTIGEKLIQFTVKSSNQTVVFYNRLVEYVEIFNRLEEKYGNHHLIELGRELVSEGFLLYDRGEYAAAQGVTENLNEILEEYYSTIQISEYEEPAQLNFPLISLFVSGGLFGFYVYMTRKPVQRPDAKELSMLLEKERGGVLVGGKEEKD